MKKEMRILGYFALSVLMAFNAGVALAADATTLESSLEDAKTYLLNKRYTNAIQLLTSISESDEGAADPRVWLMLGRAHFRNRNLDAAGMAISNARKLNGGPGDLPDQRWVQPLLSIFEEAAGAVVIRTEKTRDLLFDWAPVTRMLGERKRLLLKLVQEGAAEATPLLKKSNTEFYLPAGRHTIGGRDIDVVAGEVAEVDGQTIKTLNTVVNLAGDAGSLDDKSPGSDEGDGESWFERNALLVGLVGGGVLVAAATTGALIACCSDSDEIQVTGFRPAVQ